MPFLRVKVGQSLQITTGLHFLPRLIIRGVMVSPTRYRLRIPAVTTQEMYVLRNIEVRSRNQFCRVKAISIKYSECVFVFSRWLSSVQCACTVLCHLWPVRLYSIFPHYFINGTIFVKHLLNIFFVLNISHSEKNSARYHKRSWVFV